MKRQLQKRSKVNLLHSKYNTEDLKMEMTCGLPCIVTYGTGDTIKGLWFDVFGDAMRWINTTVTAETECGDMSYYTIRSTKDA